MSPYCLFGAKNMLENLLAFEEHSHAALKGTDPEDIHQTRVASRRLLTVLSLFPECLPEKKQKKWAGEIRKAAKALSSARDLDVQATHINDYLKGRPCSPMNKGPALLLEKNRKERKKAQEEAQDAIKEIGSGNVIEEIRRTCEKAIEKTKDAPGSGSSYAPAGMRICGMLDDLLSYECSVYKESDIEAHHKMRIVAKRLRYALETYGGLCGNESCADASTIKHLREVVEISEYVSAIKRLQEILGEMHDCDVLIESVDEYECPVNENKKDRKAVEKSLAAFRQHLKDNRANEYKRLLAYWNDALEKKIFEGIKGLIEDARNNDAHDMIEKEEELLPHAIGNADQFIEKVLKAKQKYKTDEGHEKQVRKLSLKLFDDLGDLHGIGKVGRTLLECATILHDIGWTRGGKGHNKKSMKLILEDTSLPFTSNERLIVAGIARYHRKKMPSDDIYEPGGLGAKEARMMLMLAGIMRVADGLDASHGAVVQNIKAKTDKKRVTIECTAYGNTPAEERASEEKKDLLEKVSGNQVLINWRRLPAKAKPAS